MELADLVLVNKADGELAAVAATTASDYAAALHLVRPKTPAWTARVLLCSALELRGIDEAWSAIQEHHDALSASSALAARRAAQAQASMWSELSEGMLDHLRADGEAARLAASLEAEVVAGRLAPATAARQILDAFLR